MIKPTVKIDNQFAYKRFSCSIFYVTPKSMPFSEILFSCQLCPPKKSICTSSAAGITSIDEYPDAGITPIKLDDG